MEWAGVKTEDDIYQYLTTNLKPMDKNAQEVYDVVANHKGWNPILGYTNSAGLEHTMYRSNDGCFCFDVRELPVQSKKGFPNMGSSGSFYGLIKELVDKYSGMIE